MRTKFDSSALALENKKVDKIYSSQEIKAGLRHISDESEGASFGIVGCREQVLRIYMGFQCML